MIDTIAFKIPVDKQIIDKLKQSCFSRYRHEIFNFGESEIVYDVFASQFKASFDRQIRFRIDDQLGYIDFSGGFSLPKLVYGHNCYMVYDYLAALDYFKNLFESSFGVDLPPVVGWILNRVDVCYNFRLGSNEDVLRTIDFFKNFEYPRKKPHIYDTSIYYASRSYTFKLYDKKSEFFKHDFRDMFKKDRKKVIEIEELSRFLLRYEVEIRNQALKNYFISRADLLKGKCEVLIGDLNYNFFFERLNFYLNKFLSLGGKNISDSQVYYQLKIKYKHSKAADLFLFWTGIIKNKAMTKRLYGKRTYYRRLADLKKADISLISIETEQKVDLCVPTVKCSNVDDLWQNVLVSQN